MLEFVKMQSNGNHFLVLNHWDQRFDTAALKAITVQNCDVKKGIGADGLLVIERSDTQMFKMRLFNKNGSEAEMCGNGARCLARYAFDKRITGDTMSFETMAGIIEATVKGSKVKIKVGAFREEEIFTGQTFNHQGVNHHYSFMTLGVPHVVIQLGNYEVVNYDLMVELGTRFDKNHTLFPEGTNVNFAKFIDKATLEVATYERGVESITDSCGTGSCASVMAVSQSVELVSPVRVINPGGENIVYFNKINGISTIELEGETHYCAQKIIVGGQLE